MPRRAIVDAGPLVALFNGRDADHGRVECYLRDYAGQLISTLAVYAETMHLLDFRREAQQDFLKWVYNGAVHCIDLTDDDFRRTIELHAKYADRPMDFADATLVAVAERMDINEALTLDGDFRIYKLRGRRAFSLPLLDAGR